MTETPFVMKDGLGPPAVRRIAEHLVRVSPTFDGVAFVKTATRGLGKLELKARVHQVIAALRRYLPQDIPKALKILVAARNDWSNEGLPEPKAFAAWPVIDFVGVHGLDHFDESMDALHRLTSLFSAEFAIRPLIDHDPKRALGHLRRWLDDPDEHVRRLVSEGTRPRLPWAPRLRAFETDPTPTYELLERLRGDSSLYVRRSVANHLNDLTKSDPDLVLDYCERWSKGASEDTKWIVRHATRTLVKSGNKRALMLLGFNPAAKIEIRDFTVTPKRLKLGGTLTFSFDLRSRSKSAEPLVIDYAVHHVKADGGRTAKVFKLQTITAEPRASTSVAKRHTIRPISTRRYYPGRHAIELLINGRSRGVVEFDLSL